MKTKSRLDHETAQRVLNADLCNLLRRVREGTPLTTAQRNLIAREAERGAQPAASGQSCVAFAHSKSELAKTLGVSRQLVQAYARHPDAPRPRDDGRHDVAAWRHFLAEHSRLPQFADDPGYESQTRARAEQILIQNDRLRLKLMREKEQLIPKLLAQQIFGRLVTAAKARCYASIIRFVTLARMADSTTAASEAVRAEMDGIWRSLTDGKWNTVER